MRCHKSTTEEEEAVSLDTRRSAPGGGSAPQPLRPGSREISRIRWVSLKKSCRTSEEGATRTLHNFFRVREEEATPPNDFAKPHYSNDTNEMRQTHVPQALGREVLQASADGTHRVRASPRAGGALPQGLGRPGPASRHGLAGPI